MSFIKRILDRFDSRLRINIDRLPPGGLDALPNRLWPFIWYFVRQVRWTLVLLIGLEVALALMISIMFWYVGALVEQANYGAAMLVGGLALLLSRFMMQTGLDILYLLVFLPYFGNLVRRQLYWRTVQQSLSFFNNDFAGRVANKLLRSAPSLRDAVRSAVGAVMYAIVFTASNLWFMSQVSLWLALPLALWLIGYVGALVFFVPKVQARAAAQAEVMSTLTGQVVDSFTNFLPIKYFARSEDEDQRVVGLLHDHSRSFRSLLSSIWQMGVCVDILNTLLLFATAGVGIWLIDTQGQLGLAATAMALPMVLQATFQSGWIMHEVSGIYENLGAVQEGMEALSHAPDITDAPGARPLLTSQSGSEIVFDTVSFNYGSEGKPVLDGFDLTIEAGAKVGLVGRSGAGKSTITNLIVRAYDLAGGDIRIDGQNIANVDQDSLRRAITVVTQDSYLFNRSIRDNLRYGKPDASDEEIMDVARQASAHDFILELEDHKGRRGYDAHVGERGVKLSGGQRQRIGIARALLKQAPILILDEATSALDSESELAIQAALETIMVDKTVIAIAHRLSTLRKMDRIIVMDQGRIIEDGSPRALAAQKGGHYAKYWHMQSESFAE